MGSSQSSNSNDQQISHGFRIVYIHKNSPADTAGLEVFFDYIIKYDDISLKTPENKSLSAFHSRIQNLIGKPLKLDVYNSRHKNIREVTIIPRETHGKSLLGAVINYDSFENAENEGLRVLETFDKSPAQYARLIPYTDYILSSKDQIFRDVDSFIDFLNMSLNQQQFIVVYNSHSKTIREVTIFPNYNWGGEGCIGCNIGTGYLNRIPPSQSILNSDVNFSVNSSLLPSLYTNQSQYSSDVTEHNTEKQVNTSASSSMNLNNNDSSNYVISQRDNFKNNPSSISKINCFDNNFPHHGFPSTLKGQSNIIQPSFSNSSTDAFFGNSVGMPLHHDLRIPALMQSSLSTSSIFPNESQSNLFDISRIAQQSTQALPCDKTPCSNIPANHIQGLTSKPSAEIPFLEGYSKFIQLYIPPSDQKRSHEEEQNSYATKQWNIGPNSNFSDIDPISKPHTVKHESENFTTQVHRISQQFVPRPGVVFPTQLE